MQILSFVMVVIFILAVGYGLSLLERRRNRCLMLHEMYCRKRANRQRVWCRFKG